MDILIKKEILKNALQNIISIIDKSSVKPILSNFLLKTLEPVSEDEGLGKVEFSATDYELSVIEQVPAEIMAHGSICLSAKKLYDIGKEFQGENIRIKSTEQLWIHITSDTSELRLPSVEVGLYPQTLVEDLPEKVVIPTEILKKCIDMTLYAAQTNEARRNLMGVCLSIQSDNKLRWLATDGHRLSQVMEDSITVKIGENREVIIPKKALTEVRRASDLFSSEVIISFDDRTLQFAGENIVFKTRLIEGKFPNCDPIIPKDNNLVLFVERDRLINSLKIVSSISNEKLKPVKFSLNKQKLRLESEKADYGEVYDEISVDFNGEAQQMGFNARYLLDSLNVMKGAQVKMELKNPMSPCVIKDPADEKALGVIMPLRIEW